jgi:hypothetical protein
MRRTIRALTIAVGLCTLSLAVPAQSSALIVGIGDQKPETFSQPLFQQLNVKRTRLIVAYNELGTQGGREAVDRWMAAARAARLEIMVAFNPAQGMRCPARPCSAPSVRSYTRGVRQFRARYPFIKYYQPWNESNSRTQPTSGTRGARRVAQYYLALRRMCGRRCIVTGADIQDIGDFVGYTRTFLRAVGRSKPRIMGFHNYTDTNRFSYRNTTKFVRAMPRGVKVWLTETGGIYEFTTQSGVQSLPPDEARAARSMSHMYRIARRFSRVIDRIYIYQWSKNFPGDRFDAGIVNPDGTPRQSYEIVRRNRRYIR